MLKKQRDRLDKFFGGLRNLKTLPDLVVIVGQPNERNAVSECQKLGIPTITLLDSNCDPTLAEYGIPANDDSTRSVELILDRLAVAR
jgi:small subunit ribosomal protein S2